MKTEDGYEYIQGKQYWYIASECISARLDNITPYEPFKGWYMSHYEPMLGNDYFAFKTIENARKWLEDGGFIKGTDYKKSLLDIVKKLDESKSEDLYRIFKELFRAEQKFPKWPEDMIHRQAILGEECGELQRACLQYVYEDGSVENIQEEAIQTAAMSLRFMFNLIEAKTV